MRASHLSQLYQLKNKNTQRKRRYADHARVHNAFRDVVDPKLLSRSTELAEAEWHQGVGTTSWCHAESIADTANHLASSLRRRHLVWDVLGHSARNALRPLRDCERE